MKNSEKISLCVEFHKLSRQKCSETSEENDFFLSNTLNEMIPPFSNFKNNYLFLQSLQCCPLYLLKAWSSEKLSMFRETEFSHWRKGTIFPCGSFREKWLQPMCRVPQAPISTEVCYETRGQIVSACVSIHFTDSALQRFFSIIFVICSSWGTFLHNVGRKY